MTWFLPVRSFRRLSAENRTSPPRVYFGPNRTDLYRFPTLFIYLPRASSRNKITDFRKTIRPCNTRPPAFNSSNSHSARVLWNNYANNSIVYSLRLYNVALKNVEQQRRRRRRRRRAVFPPAHLTRSHRVL